MNTFEAPVKCGIVLLILTLLSGCASTAGRNELLVAAAADLDFALREMIPRFEHQTGRTVKLTLGSSGNIYAQIKNGGPFDVFLSADVAYPRQLENAGLTEPGSTFIYGIGHIVVWVPMDSPIDVQGRGIAGLADPSIRKIAIANPEHAPYGRAAIRSLQYFGIYEAVMSKLVYGENVSQAAQLVQSRAADAGVIGLSLALAENMKNAGHYWEVPIDSYPKIEQAAVILKRAEQAGHHASAQAFLDFLKSAEARALLKRYGFFVPGQDGPSG